MDLFGVLCFNDIFCVGWIFLNIISFVIEGENDFIECSRFIDGIDIVGYVYVFNILVERLLFGVEKNGCV